MPLIPAPAGVLEVDALWQQDNPNNPNTDTVALLCHPNPLFDGTMNNKVVTTMYRFARDNGMHVIRFNFRGVGQSTGEHDYADGEVVDAMTVLQWIAEQTNARKLWLGGFSFGGYVTARVAEQVLEAPHIWGLGDFEITKIALIAPSVEKNDSSDIACQPIKRLRFMAMLMKLPDNMQAFAERLGIAVSIVDGAGHFFHGRLSELKGLLEKHTFGSDA
ncbi:LOW QUALITY PROTEIN: alpha/beta hydrolase [Psychrobacter sp. JCM 18903]|nr:LOW QUALITY PROTEIN: alpha/beta hydrolase [Psychrobacter sp. JCM 18903]